MHDDLKSFKPKPIPKIAQKLQNFEKPQSLSKIPKVRSKNEIIPEEEINLKTED